MHNNGGGLYLQVRGPARSLILRHKIDGKTRMMGLGWLAKISLGAARDLRGEARKAIESSGDPLAARRAEVERRREEAAKAVSFKQAAERLINSKSAAWKNAKHRDQWTATLETYAFPFFGDLPVQAVDTGRRQALCLTYEDLAVRYRDRMASCRLRTGRRHDFTRSNIELTAMHIALDHILLDITRRQRARPVRADVVENKDGTIDIENGQDETRDLDSDRFSGFHVGNIAHKHQL